jgi:hypothetical protein
MTIYLGIIIIILRNIIIQESCLFFFIFALSRVKNIFITCNLFLATIVTVCEAISFPQTFNYIKNECLCNELKPLPNIQSSNSLFSFSMHTYMCILDLSCWSLNRDLKLNCLYNELELHVLKHHDV